MDGRIRAIVAVAAVGVASLAGGSAGAQATSLGGPGWGAAIEVPGIPALAPGGYAAITSVSCASAGNCSAGGNYGFRPGSPATEAFVVSQIGGTWHKAIEVPGTAALNRGVQAEITSVSCASAGNCSAGGFYLDGSSRFQAFVVSEVHGAWHKAIEVPGSAALDQGGSAALDSVSCASAGNCSAGGSYGNSSIGTQAFVVSQIDGTWGKAMKVPGTAALNQGREAELGSVSCASAGNCSAGGSYANSTGPQAYVVSEVHGTWHKAIEVPGTAALNRGALAEITSVSCASAGNCSAGGSYKDGSGGFQSFVVSQANGTWDKAIEVPGTAALNQGGDDFPSEVSCGAVGNCSAGGFYLGGSGQQAFVVSQAGGTWHKAIKVPGTAALNQGGSAELGSVSCASAGNCSAGGTYADGSNNEQAFAVSQIGGTWHKAIEVPGTPALNQGGQAKITSVSCASAGHCSAGGTYADSSGVIQAFVVSQT